MMTVMERVARCGVVPVIVLEEVSQAVPTARALLAGGIDVMEITFRTAAAKDSIAAVVKEVPEMLVGAGTVISMEQLEAAIGAGAQFIVSPGSDDEVISACVTKAVPVLPGVVTPSEVLIGLKHGLSVFKFFPAENYGGLKTIKALSGPFPQIKFLPTGGISEKNVADYFANPRIAAVGGSWMATGDMIKNGDYAEITNKSAEAVALYKAARG
jgi:2-dehydro-3-deoxyphosphogluconate aldolase/(4S)-4-hydroxy-2-oxoglutarate aldolase